MKKKKTPLYSSENFPYYNVKYSVLLNIRFHFEAKEYMKFLNISLIINK